MLSSALKSNCTFLKELYFDRGSLKAVQKLLWKIEMKNGIFQQAVKSKLQVILMITSNFQRKHANEAKKKMSNSAVNQDACQPGGTVCLIDNLPAEFGP